MSDTVFVNPGIYNKHPSKIFSFNFDDSAFSRKSHGLRYKISGSNKTYSIIRGFDFSIEDSNITQINDCSLEEAKEKIARYFKKNDGKEISYSHLFDELNLDIELIIDACAELEAEGKIGASV